MQSTSDSIAAQLDSLDLGLFGIIDSESWDDDRRSWLAVQRTVRRPAGYVYLEIGSHLGGSIQQHLVDPLCRRIYSIDPRPASQPDDRGLEFHYENNSTERMMNNLALVASDQLGKVVTFEADARHVGPEKIVEPPTFCFIDGEHTRDAVLSDFEFCLRVSDPNAAICLHDGPVIWPALREIVTLLEQRGVTFRASLIGGSTFGVFLGACAVDKDPFVLAHGQDGRRWIKFEARRVRFKRFVPKWIRPGVRWVARRSSSA